MKHVAFILILPLFLACGAFNPILPTPSPSPTLGFRPIATLTPVCISSEPTEADIDRALSFPGDTFDSSEWESSYAISENRVSVTWQNDPESAVAYDEALIFPCGYEEPDIDHYFNDEGWETIFQDYESYTAIDSCIQNDGLRLYQFTAQYEGDEYAINFWVQNDTANRVMTFMLVFPSESLPFMNDYASELFPDLVSCN